STYRQICAAVARKHGVTATFMPKPFTGVSANGAHHHFTLVDEDGTNVFYDPDGPAKLSEIGLQFMGGILDHYRALCALGASTVNSRSEEHTSELQSHLNLVCRLLLEKKKNKTLHTNNT